MEEWESGGEGKKGEKGRVGITFAHNRHQPSLDAAALFIGPEIVLEYMLDVGRASDIDDPSNKGNTYSIGVAIGLVEVDLPLEDLIQRCLDHVQRIANEWVAWWTGNLVARADAEYGALVLDEDVQDVDAQGFGDVLSVAEDLHQELEDARRRGEFRQCGHD